MDPNRHSNVYYYYDDCYYVTVRDGNETDMTKTCRKPTTLCERVYKYAKTTEPNMAPKVGY